LIEPGDRRHQCASAHIDEDLVGFEHRIADLDFIRSDESGVALVNRATAQRLQRTLDAVGRRAHDSVLARLDGFHVDTDPPADVHAVVGGTARNMRRIGARDQRLGRGAPGVVAGAAEKLALDDRNLPAGSRQSPRQGRPSLSSADDDRLVFLHDYLR
jgi:hypothetical protein